MEVYNERARDSEGERLSVIEGSKITRLVIPCMFLTTDVNGTLRIERNG